MELEYRDYPTVERTLHFKNTRDRPTSILENIQAVDVRLERNGEKEFVLHHSKATQFRPPTASGMTLRLSEEWRSALPRRGRPTNSDLCSSNVEWPGQGMIIAVDWPSQWAAQLTRDEGSGLRVRAGQELTYFKFLPEREFTRP